MGTLTVSGGKFNLGKMLMTSGVAAECDRNPLFGRHVIYCLGRHARGDWGNLSAEDIAENEYALGRDLRLFSAYEEDGFPKIWIITEADRSVTTVLLPEEY